MVIINFIYFLNVLDQGFPKWAMTDIQGPRAAKGPEGGPWAVKEPQGGHEVII